MTEQEQRIAIAEACGWKQIKLKSHSFGDSSKTVERDGWKMPNGAEVENRMLPDYLHDLNAMHEAEETLPDTRRGYYNANLSLLATGRNLSAAVKEPGFIYNLLHATAAQRAEAFLRTIGKWKESNDKQGTTRRTRTRSLEKG